MALHDILVHIDGGPGHETRLRLAIALARQHRAHLTGLYGVEVVPAATLAVPAIGSYGGDLESINAAATAGRDVAEGIAEQMEAAFRAALKAAGVAGDWQVLAGMVAELTMLAARAADLTIVGQIDPGDPGTGQTPGLPERVLLESGRPVLIVPYVGHFTTLGRRVLIAWNATREAARAVGDALPLMAGAEAVTILSIGTAGEAEAEDGAAAPLVRHLSRHGIAATGSSLVADDIGVGDLILSRAADLGSDLIVMGGYGHSPTRERFLGGVTRSLLQHMTVPVLMAH